MLIKRVNILVRKIGEAPEEYTPLRIDRNTKFGNIYRISDKLTRSSVIALHRKDVEASLASKGYLYKQLRKVALRVIAGEKICLECHCHPKPCHGNNLVTAINTIIAGETQ